MLDRRGILKLLPVAGIPVCSERILGKELAAAAEIRSTSMPANDRYLMVFRITHPIPAMKVELLQAQARSGLDQLGFRDVKAIVVPYGMDVDVFSLPGGVECSVSAQSSSASSA